MQPRVIFVKTFLFAALLAMASCGGKTTEEPQLAIDPNQSVFFDAEATTANAVTINVLTNQASWDVVSNRTDHWPTISKGNDSFTISTTPNETLSDIIATLRVTAGDATPIQVYVSQKGVKVDAMANCYIVAPNSTVRIPVKQANADGTTRINGAFDYKFLWTDNPAGMSANGAVKTITVNGSGSDGYFTVATGATEGNALFAATVSGVVKWSWHIWVTSFDPVATGQNYVNGNWAQGKLYYGKKIMDRNLGAMNNDRTTASTKNMGLVYQWGHNAPFPAHTQAWADNTTEPNLYNATGAGGNTMIQKVAVASLNNLDNAISNPTTFYYNNTTPNDWYTNSATGGNNNLWGGNGAKTAYDPCPPGWKVSPSAVWADFYDINDPRIPPTYYKDRAESGYQSTLQLLANINASSILQGAGLYYATASQTQQNHNNYDVFYPAQGYRSYTSGNFSTGSIGNYAFYWSSLYGSSAGRGTFLGASDIIIYGDTGRAMGMPVRCLQE